MKYTSIFGKDLREFIFNFNEKMKVLFNNINENNLNLNQIEIKSGIPTPTAKVGKTTFYEDESGKLKYMKPDGTTGTINVTPDP
jgi:hypothetical protein